MNITPQQINLDFNCEFQAIYPIYLQIEAESVRLLKEKDKLYETPERQAHLKNIEKFSQAFLAFGEKYKTHAEKLFFLPETIALIPAEKLTAIVMEDLYKVCNTIKYIKKIETELFNP